MQGYGKKRKTIIALSVEKDSAMFGKILRPGGEI